MNNSHEPVKVKAHHSPNYFLVFLALAAITAFITAIELYISSLSFIPQQYIHAMFVVLALIKASLVAMYYMHLKFDSRVYTFLFGLPVLFAVFLISMLIAF